MLYPGNGGAADSFAVVTDGHVVFVRGYLLVMESQLHPILSFGLISYLETAYLFFAEQADIEQVEQMFHVFDTVQVAVYVQVTVLHTVRFAGGVVFHRSNFTRFFNRTGTVGDISTQPSTSSKVGRRVSISIAAQIERAKPKVLPSPFTSSKQRLVNNLPTSSTQVYKVTDSDMAG